MQNEDILKGKWKQMRGKIQEKWGDISDDDLDRVDGQAEQLEGLLQERYGIARDEARKQLKQMADNC